MKTKFKFLSLALFAIINTSSTSRSPIWNYNHVILMRNAKSKCNLLYIPDSRVNSTDGKVYVYAKRLHKDKLYQFIVKKTVSCIFLLSTDSSYVLSIKLYKIHDQSSTQRPPSVKPIVVYKDGQAIDSIALSNEFVSNFLNQFSLNKNRDNVFSRMFIDDSLLYIPSTIGFTTLNFITHKTSTNKQPQDIRNNILLKTKSKSNRFSKDSF